jgi:PAS domain S-box-containing protein
VAQGLGPRATRVYGDLRRHIQDGLMPVGVQLPSQSSLAERYGVALMTIRQAIARLELDGYVSARIGAGTFVDSRSPTGRKDEPAGLQSVIEASPQAIVTFDLDGNVTGWNPAAERVFGWTREEAIGRPHPSVPEDGMEVYRARFAHVAAGGTGEVLARRVCKDGREIDMNFRFGPIRDADGSVIGAVSFVTDVTARQQADAAAKSSEARFRAVFERGAIGMAIVAEDGGFLQANEALQRFLGYSADELVQTTRWRLTHPHDVEAEQLIFAEVMAGRRESYRLSKRYIRRDGQVIWGRVTVSLIPAEPGEPKLSVVMVEDITARRQAEADLRESEARYRQLVEDANDVIFTLDLDGRFLSINARGEELSGYSKSEAVGLDMAEVLTPASLTLVRKKMADKLAGAPMTTYVIELVARDGEVIPLEVSTRLTYRGGNPVGVQGIARVVADRGQVNRSIA